MCAEYKQEMYCGMQTNENRINKMTKCPIKPRKKR